jgi:hypothetical protein
MVLTLQPRGSGDFFGTSSLPTNSASVSVEARVLNTGPAYLDIALPGGAFEATFGPAPNDVSGKGDRRMRLRADLFFSNIPYTRMVDALSQLTSIPDRKKKQLEGPTQTDSNAHDNICMDEALRDAILSTYALNDASSPLFRDTDACDLREIVSRVDETVTLNIEYLILILFLSSLAKRYRPRSWQNRRYIPRPKWRNRL